MSVAASAVADRAARRHGAGSALWRDPRCRTVSTIHGWRGGRLPNLLSSKERIEHGTIPPLILHGSVDRVMPVEMGRELYALSGATDRILHSVEGAGNTNVWQPETQPVLVRFIARIAK